MWVKILITSIASAAIIVHAVFPSYKIDVITLGLFVLALIPWLSSLVETFEFPGGWKLKFKALEEAGRRAEKVGLVSGDISDDEISKYSFQIIGESDPNLALAGLRIEIEKRLKELAAKNGIGTKMQGVGRLLQMLSDHELVGHSEKSVLIDMLGLLNSAVHGARIERRSYFWAMEYGPRILKTLDGKLGKNTRVIRVRKKREQGGV